MKAPDSIGELFSILQTLSTRGESGTPGVAVKCVDIRGNTRGEGGSLARC